MLGTGSARVIFELCKDMNYRYVVKTYRLIIRRTKSLGTFYKPNQSKIRTSLDLKTIS